MNTVLYFSATGAVYETRAFGKADIDKLVQSKGLQCFTSADGQFDFWFSPSTQRCQRRTNRIATEILLSTTPFTAKSVPLLRGSVVVASHDTDGDLDGLSWQQLDLLAEKSGSLSKRDERVLNRRINRDDRRQLRNVEALRAAESSKRTAATVATTAVPAAPSAPARAAGLPTRLAS